MRSHRARLALALVPPLASIDCARGSVQLDPNAPAVDARALDATRLDAFAPTSDAPRSDTALDAPALSADSFHPADSRADAIATGATACTASTAAAVCGGRPCVDGFCCDGACTGECRSCAIAGSQGHCTDFASATDPESECAEQAPATCGTTGVCNGAGACAHHASGVACDDGAACTTGDVCDGAGTCRGAAPASCAPSAGNECCAGSCDGASGCHTAAMSCADRCDANRLRTSLACQGCGAAGAVGTCTGANDFACNSTVHSLCQTVACGGQDYHCTNDGGVWQWRTATLCDDGNACTHTDTCNANTCAGTAVTCTSDACATRACAGTATCAVTAHTGVACDDGNAATNSDVCSAAGVCVGTSVCALPSDACSDGTQNRDRCSGARVIGRRAAATTSGYSVSSNTCSAYDRFDDCDWDAGSDHAYRIWVRTGEIITVNLNKGSGCVNSSWDATLKLYQGTDCTTVTCSGDRWCHDFVGSGAQTYTAPREGWVVVVVDGSTAFDDEGNYTLHVHLTGCRAAGCECP